MMRGKRILAGLLLGVCVPASSGRGQGDGSSGPPSRLGSAALDRASILTHTHGIFQSFMRRDFDTIRTSHTADWLGFQARSRKIGRGIDDYMANVDTSASPRSTPFAYEIVDYEIRTFGDVGVLIYSANYARRLPSGGLVSYRLRSIDLMRKEGDEWNQSGSHISVAPRDVIASVRAGTFPPGAPSADSTPERTIGEVGDGSEFEVLLERVRDSYEAHISGNAGRLRRGHASGWMGFKLFGDGISRGVSSSFQKYDMPFGYVMKSCELVDFEIQVHGRVAFVFHLARAGGRSRRGMEITLGLRTLDVFEKRDGEWVISMSHVSMVPRDLAELVRRTAGSR